MKTPSTLVLKNLFAKISAELSVKRSVAIFVGVAAIAALVLSYGMKESSSLNASGTEVRDDASIPLDVSALTPGERENTAEMIAPVIAAFSSQPVSFESNDRQGRIFSSTFTGMSSSNLPANPSAFLLAQTSDTVLDQPDDPPENDQGPTAGPIKPVSYDLDFQAFGAAVSTVSASNGTVSVSDEPISDEPISDEPVSDGTIPDGTVPDGNGTPIAPVPEPLTMFLFGSGLVGLVVMKKKFGYK